MTRPLEEFLHVDLVIAESSCGFRTGDRDRAEQGAFRVHHPHPAAAPAAGGLDNHRIADLPRRAQVFAGIFAQCAAGARHAWDSGLGHQGDRRDLVAHQADGFRLRPDPREPALFHALGKIGTLGQEAVARVDGDRVRDFRGTDDRGHVQVAVAAGRRPDAHRFISQQDMLESRIGGRMHGDRLDAQLAAGPQDPQRYFASIGNDDLVQHEAYSTMNRGWPNSTGSPLLIRTARTRPAISDSIWFIIFMASMTHSTWPASIWSPSSTKGFAPGAGAL